MISGYSKVQDICSSYIVSSLWLPKTNVLAGQTDNIALLVHDTCSCGACADIDTNIVVLDDLDFVVRVDGHLARLLPRRLPVGHATLHGGQMLCCAVCEASIR